MFLVRPRFIIIGMTSSAVGLISSGGPGSYLGITLMTLYASYSGIMVSGIAGRGVIEIYSQPVSGVVTSVALQVSPKMRRAFAGGGRAVVTGGTTPRHQAVIHSSRGPGQIVVATITLSRGLNMGGALTGRRGAIVAGGAGTCNPSVIKIHRGPVSGDMTIITHIAG